MVQDIFIQTIVGIIVAGAIGFFTWLFSQNVRNWFRNNWRAILVLCIVATLSSQAPWIFAYLRNASALSTNGNIPIPQNWQQTFREEFSNIESSNEWYSGSYQSDYGKYNYDINNKYIWQIDSSSKEACNISRQSLKNTESIIDGYLSVESRGLYSTPGKGDFRHGLFFRESDAGYYSFEINEHDQEYALWFWNKTSREWATLIPITKSTNILPNQSNTVSVLLIKDTIELFVNGHSLKSISDTKSLNGRFGLIGDLRCPGVNVFEFDNFMVFQPN